MSHNVMRHIKDFDRKRNTMAYHISDSFDIGHKISHGITLKIDKKNI